MYNVIRDKILSGDYKLKHIIRKIDTVWIDGSLTDQEREDLIALAIECVEVADEIDIVAKIIELEKKISDNTKAINELKGVEPPTPEIEGYPPFELNHLYYTDDIISFEGKDYKCIAPSNVVVVWSPKDTPQYWEEIIAQ